MSDQTPPQPNTVKIHAFLAHAGVAARRKAEELVRAGRVEVNGAVETNVARRIDPQQDSVRVDGRPISAQPDAVVVLALNKPIGVVSSVSDPDGKPVVTEFVPPEFQQYRLYPVGRLDEDSEGLILLTNDGDLAYRLTHPQFHVPKTYHVRIAGHLTTQETRRLRSGVPLKDGTTQPAEVELLDSWDSGEELEITIHEGRNHQVRRMLRHVNHEVQRLRRVRIGELELGKLGMGQVREVQPEEIWGNITPTSTPE